MKSIQDKMDHLENLQKQDKEEAEKASDALLEKSDYSLDDRTLDKLIEDKKREVVQMVSQDDVPTVTDIKDDDDEDANDDDKDSLVDLEYIDEKHMEGDKD